ncbi:chromate efflux transporter [Acidovorax sp. Be4]|uniref:Chromate efflux transporter n=1 Tax=Acidovorax bellezanensis TaxID=2976702 RepID=A0ABT2PN41_9BURK|nr:chromate efflux transporter [Acidovorax sp. Be4]MCT9811890.1 chromate efflux transporter [Acidovorax sp. Be4]
MPQGSAMEVFLAFLKLGLTAFGGPVAHLGYFRVEFVERRRWIDDSAYADLVALCQFLPGPASSQVGFALGLGRAGWPGALAAWLGFTLPSAVVLMLFALGIQRWSGLAQSGAVQGLKLAAVAVVAQAVWGMARTLCPDRPRAGLAIAAALLALAIPSALGQLAAIAAAGMAGLWWLKPQALPASTPRHPGLGKTAGAVLLLVFTVLLLLSLALAAGSSLLAQFATFYQAGALVFGGGHVVLALLQAGVVPPGWITNDAFIAGYGLAQAVPGPLFAFAAYLGALMPAPMGGWVGGMALLVAIFLPGLLLVLGALPFWEALRQLRPVQRAMAGANAAVVGLLLAALYDPLWINAIHSRLDFGIALAAFGLLAYGRQSPLRVVALSALAGWALL